MLLRALPFVFLFTTLLVQTRCQGPAVSPLSGVVQRSDAFKPLVYLIQPRQFDEIAASYGGVVVDSALLDDKGRFAFSTARSGLFILAVQRKDSRYANKLEDEIPGRANYMPLVLESGKTISCRSTAETFQSAFSIAQPDAENLALLRLRDLRARAHARETTLGAAPDEHNLLEHEAALARYRTPLMAFADTSSTFWSALVAARWVAPDGDYERMPEFVHSLCEKWSAQRPGDAWVAQLCKRADRKNLPILLGDTIPDYAMPMLSGDTLMLRQLLGRRLTILDIWASWCMPCRKENREVLLPLWTTWQDKGLQIVGYSIDAGAAAWKAGVSKDGAIWPQSSHLSGDATPLLDTLRIRTIPANLVLDAKGKVLAKNLHGEALRAFVEAYLQ